MAWAQPTHTVNNTYTWGGVQLRKVVWDLYVRSPTGVTRETSNDRFTIQEPSLPIVKQKPSDSLS